MKKISTLIIGLFLTINMLGQYPSYQWAGNLPSANKLVSAEDPSGNVYVAGNFTGVQDFDFGPGSFTLNATSTSWGYIAKYTSGGTFIWATAVITNTSSSSNVYIQQIKVDNTGNPCITGYVDQSGHDFDPGPATVKPPTPYASNSNPNGFVAKYDINGNYQWAQTIYQSSSSLATPAIDLVIDNANNRVRIGGYVNPTAFLSSMNYASTSGCSMNIPASFTVTSYGYILSYNLTTGDGIVPFTESFLLGKDTYNPSLEIDNTSNLYYTHNYINISTGNNQQSVIVKKNSALTTAWTATIGASGNNVIPYDIALDASNNVYVHGNFFNTVDFDASASTSTLTPVGSYDSFLLQYSNTGAFMWCGGFGNAGFDVPKAICVDKQTGDIYLTCAISNSGPVDVDFGASITTFSTASSSDFMLLKYGSAKNFIWGTMLPNITSFDINSYPTGNIYFNARSNSSFDLNFSPSVNLIGSGGFVAKYAGCSSAPLSPGTITGLNTMCTGASTTNYSVAPVSGATSYSWSLPGIGWSGTSTTNTISLTPGSGSGNLSVYAVNACGASSTSILSITVNPLPTISVNSGSICSGSSFTMSPSGASTYTFSSGSPIVSPTSTASYSVTGTSTAGCVGSNTAVASVTVNITPTIMVNSGSICNGQSFTITPSGANTYTYQTGSAIVSPTATSSYTVTGTSAAGCVGASPAVSNVTVNPLPTVSANTSNSVICGPPFQGTATLTASGATTYTWNTTTTTTAIAVSPSITTMYTVSGTDANGCVNSASFTQSVSTCASVNQLAISVNEINVYPNPFSNKITLVSSGAKQSLQLFNVLGSLVYESMIETEKTEIDLSNQSNGIYFVRIGSATKKIIKN